ncbi:MAG: type II toxin-antitoxin system RelE/ParE family toxin [Nanoarchaeota archaeon]|nr:type II toxin-antitoxin system RelE/ParE family toxin [Nanoarchaeota archaeon]
MFEIKLDKQPEHFLSKCENEVFERISNKLETLKQNPVPHDAKRVLGYELPTFRIRIGKYRALYRVNYEEKRIVVVKIDKRDKVYD